MINKIVDRQRDALRLTTQTEEQTNLPLIAAIVGVAVIGRFMFGFDSGVINGTFTGLVQACDLDPGNLGLVASSILLGRSVRAFLAGRLADAMGRRKTMQLAAIRFIVSAQNTVIAKAAPTPARATAAI